MPISSRESNKQPRGREDEEGERDGMIEEIGQIN